MATQYGFHVDMRFCTGCHACVVACKELHDLPVGLNLRHVFEIEGGAYDTTTRASAAGVFAYYISMSCNHCTEPLCVKNCPTGALFKRQEDGVVIADSSLCVGCRYCTWSCPYEAPQFNPLTGTTLKCDLCVDRLMEGMEPACVAACPLRLIHVGPIEELRERYGGTAAAPVLPDPSITNPNIRYTLHPDALRQDGVRVVKPPVPEAVRPAHGEGSLVLFTLLVQAALGATGLALILTLRDQPGAGPGQGLVRASALLLSVGLVASLWHLGTPRRALGALRRLRTSWLSREVLGTGAFAGATLLLAGVPPGLPIYPAGLWIAVFLGLAAVVCMVRTYQSTIRPAWNGPRTPALFFSACATLGPALAALLLAVGAFEADPGVLPTLWAVALAGGGAQVGAQAGARLLLTVTGIGGLMLAGCPGLGGFTTALLIVGAVLLIGSEALGRIHFFAGAPPLRVGGDA